MTARDQLIVKYFSLGLQQSEINHLLRNIHNIKISLRTLKRILSKLDLFRRKNFSKIEEVASFIEDQLEKSGQMHGYRWMHVKCLQHGFTVTQDVVRELLSLLDPQGVQIRQRKRLRRRRYKNSGPNNVWHIDSYDKLKPYGICINGAIDGFSRKIIWLHAGKTSNDPKVVAGYYLNALKTLGGCPRIVRADMGTENGVVEKIQNALGELFLLEDNRKSFIYGRSTSNQRIESWWCILRKQNAQYWMNLFQNLKDEALFNGTFVDKSLIQFCFLGLIQDELNQVVLEWDNHKIQNSRNSISPVGRPTIMYEVPDLYNAENKLVKIPQGIFCCLEEECTYYGSSCDEDIKELCLHIIEEYSLNPIREDPYDAVRLYITLRQKVYNYLNE